MKISELSTDEALDVMVRITEPVTNIIADKEIFDMFDMRLQGKDIKTKGQQVVVTARLAASMIPILLKVHRSDTCEIIAAINGMTVDDVLKMNVMKTMRMAKEVIMDKEMIAFFKSCVDGEKSGA